MENQNQKLQLIEEIKTLTEALTNMALPVENLTEKEWKATEEIQVLIAKLHTL